MMPKREPQLGIATGSRFQNGIVRGKKLYLWQIVVVEYCCNLGECTDLVLDVAGVKYSVDGISISPSTSYINLK